jgi:probable rRNA maturation factor
VIEFVSHPIEFELPEQESVKRWLLLLVESEGGSVEQLTYIFVSDEFLLELNQEHLDHDYYTDILTFPYQSGPGVPLQSDIYISLDRVQDNAQTYDVPWEEELARVMAHGVLHLLGYDDHGSENERLMRQKEEEALRLRMA